MYQPKTNRTKGRIYEWMKRNLFERQKVAEILGVSHGFLTKVDSGKELPSAKFSQMLFVLSRGELFFTPRRTGPDVY